MGEPDFCISWINQPHIAVFPSQRASGVEEWVLEVPSHGLLAWLRCPASPGLARRMPNNVWIGRDWSWEPCILKIQSSAVITRSILSRYYSRYCDDGSRTYITIQTHNTHAIPRPHGREIYGKDFEKNNLGKAASYKRVSEMRAYVAASREPARDPEQAAKCVYALTSTERRRLCFHLCWYFAVNKTLWKNASTDFHERWDWYKK